MVPAPAEELEPVRVWPPVMDAGLPPALASPIFGRLIDRLAARAR